MSTVAREQTGSVAAQPPVVAVETKGVVSVGKDADARHCAALDAVEARIESLSQMLASAVDVVQALRSEVAELRTQNTRHQAQHAEGSQQLWALKEENEYLKQLLSASSNTRKTVEKDRSSMIVQTTDREPTFRSVEQTEEKAPSKRKKSSKKKEKVDTNLVEPVLTDDGYVQVIEQDHSERLYTSRPLQQDSGHKVSKSKDKVAAISSNPAPRLPKLKQAPQIEESQGANSRPKSHQSRRGGDNPKRN